MQFKKRNRVTNVINSIKEKFNAMFAIDKSTVLNSQTQGFICSMCLVQGITTALPSIIVEELSRKLFTSGIKCEIWHTPYPR